MLGHLVRNARRIVHTKRQNGKTIISIHDDHSKRREKERRQCNNVWGAKKVFFWLQERGYGWVLLDLEIEGIR